MRILNPKDYDPDVKVGDIITIENDALYLFPVYRLNAVLCGEVFIDFSEFNVDNGNKSPFEAMEYIVKHVKPHFVLFSLRRKSLLYAMDYTIKSVVPLI